MDLPSLAAQALASLASPTDHDRLIRLQSPLEALVAERFHGQESLCGGFRFEIDVVSTSASLDLQPLLGQPVSLELRTADNALRGWHGLCTATHALGADAGLARYLLVMEPWTALLRYRRNALIFQGLDLAGVLEQVFADYPEADWRLDITDSLPVRAITTQYRETDAQFVSRLLSEAGLAWRFDHSDGDDGGRHTLVIFDPAAELPDDGAVRFHRIDATEDSDAITAFAERRQLTSNTVQIAAWHTEQLTSVNGQGQVDAAGVPALEVFVQPRAGRFATPDLAEHAAQRLLDGLRLPHRLHAGAGSLRTLAPGHRFSLTQHPTLPDHAFVPVSVEHVAVNNLGHGIGELSQVPELERGSYRNRFIAAPADVPLVPTPLLRPTVSGPQTARVVGLPDAAVTPTRDHQVRIQFHWQRGASPNPGGLTETGSDHPGHAPGDHTSGTWVPVSEWISGPNWGSHFLTCNSRVALEARDLAGYRGPADPADPPRQQRDQAIPDWQMPRIPGLRVGP